MHTLGNKFNEIIINGNVFIQFELLVSQLASIEIEIKISKLKCFKQNQKSGSTKMRIQFLYGKYFDFSKKLCEEIILNVVVLCFVIRIFTDHLNGAVLHPYRKLSSCSCVTCPTSLAKKAFSQFKQITNCFAFSSFSSVFL